MYNFVIHSESRHLFKYIPISPSDLSNFHEKSKINWSTLGDLHANTLKLIDFMRMKGIITLDETSYLKFTQDYKSIRPPPSYPGIVVDNLALPNNMQDIINRFFNNLNNILSKIIVTPGAHLRLIGDVIADRGAFDGFTLALIDKLVKNGAIVEIIISNHDFEFIKWMEKNINANGEKEYKEMIADPLTTSSLHRLRDAIQKGMLSFKQVSDWFHTYKKTLKVLSYDYTDKGKLVMHSHAPLINAEDDILAAANDLLTAFSTNPSLMPDSTQRKLGAVCKKLNDNLNMKISAQDITGIIDCLNESIQHNADNNTITQLMEIPSFYNLMWGRVNEIHAKPISRPRNSDFLFIHGHDEHSPENAKSLDSPFGMPGEMEGKYVYCETPTLEYHANQALVCTKNIIALKDWLIEGQFLLLSKKDNLFLSESSLPESIKVVCNEIIKFLSFTNLDSAQIKSATDNQAIIVKWNEINNIISSITPPPPAAAPPTGFLSSLKSKMQSGTTQKAVEDASVTMSKKWKEFCHPEQININNASSGSNVNSNNRT